MSAIPSAHHIPRYPPHVHTGTWGTLETFTPAVRANKVCTARRAKRNDIALMAPKKPSSTQNATLQSMGMDVIKQYPGPLSLTVSRAVKLAEAPGQALFPHLTGAEQNASYTGTAVEFTERHTFVRHGKAWGAAHTGPGIRFICDSDAIAPMLPLRLRHPRARPARRPPATPPTHPPPTRSVASTCRCSSAPVFSRTRHTLHE